MLEKEKSAFFKSGGKDHNLFFFLSFKSATFPKNLNYRKADSGLRIR